MVEVTILKHVALQYSDKKQADTFFSKILGLQLKKTFTISKDLSFEIFGIKEEIGIPLLIRDLIIVLFIMLVFYAKRHLFSLEGLIEKKRLKDINS